jgi:hypothetical protein
MKTCALCTRSTSPKNGVTTSADAVLCHLCLSAYEASHEYKREQYFKKAGNEGAAAVALNDFIIDTLKIRSVDAEKERNAAAEKALAEKKASEAASAAEAAKTPAPAKNGIEKPTAKA